MNNKIDITETFIYWFWGICKLSAIGFVLYAMPRITFQNPWIDLLAVLGGTMAVLILVLNAFYHFVKRTDRGYEITIFKVLVN